MFSSRLCAISNRSKGSRLVQRQRFQAQDVRGLNSKQFRAERGHLPG